MKHETRMVAVSALLISSLLFLRAWAGPNDNLELCKYGGTAGPYTAENPLVGKLIVKPGADDTQEIWYTVIKQPSGIAVVVK